MFIALSVWSKLMVQWVQANMCLPLYELLLLEQCVLEQPGKEPGKWGPGLSNSWCCFFLQLGVFTGRWYKGILKTPRIIPIALWILSVSHVHLCGLLCPSWECIFLDPMLLAVPDLPNSIWPFTKLCKGHFLHISSTLSFIHCLSYPSPAFIPEMSSLPRFLGLPTLPTPNITLKTVVRVKGLPNMHKVIILFPRIV